MQSDASKPFECTLPLIQDVCAIPNPETGMLSTAALKSLKGNAIMSSFGDHLLPCLSKAEMKLISGFPFAKVFVIVEHMLLAA